MCYQPFVSEQEEASKTSRINIDNPKKLSLSTGSRENYAKWDELHGDILINNFRVVQNKTGSETETDSEYENDEGDVDGQTPEVGIVYDNSERDGRYVPLRIDPEHNSIQIQTDRSFGG